MSALLISLGLAYVLWVMFLAVMALKAAWKVLPVEIKVIAVPAVTVAILFDVAFNVVSSILFADMPREWTFSQRVGRYQKEGGWRALIAKWICSRLLDPFDAGEHCQ